MHLRQPVPTLLVLKCSAMVLAVAGVYAFVSNLFAVIMWKVMEGAAQGAGMFDVGNSYAEARSKVTFWDSSEWRVFLWLVLITVASTWTRAPEKRHDRLARSALAGAAMVVLIYWHTGDTIHAPRFSYFIWTMAVLAGLETSAPVRFALVPLFAGVIISSLGDRSLFPTATLKGTPLPMVLTLLEAVNSVIAAATTTVAGAAIVSWSAKAMLVDSPPSPSPAMSSPSPTSA